MFYFSIFGSTVFFGLFYHKKKTEKTKKKETFSRLLFQYISVQSIST